MRKLLYLRISIAFPSNLKIHLTTLLLHYSTPPTENTFLTLITLISGYHQSMPLHILSLLRRRRYPKIRTSFYFLLRLFFFSIIFHFLIFLQLTQKKNKSSKGPAICSFFLLFQKPNLPKISILVFLIFSSKNESIYTFEFLLHFLIFSGHKNNWIVRWKK